jgi:23S rRNA pseudouridine1911/1915/1917 synthase
MTEEQHIQITVAEDTAKTRIDKYLAKEAPDISRTRIQNLIIDGYVERNAQVLTDCSAMIEEGDVFDITLPPPESTDLKATEIPLDIVFEDEHMLVINKQAGLTVHPGAGNYQDTLVNALLFYCGDSLSGIGGVQRPGIVHRLDKDTSGLMVVAKTDKAHAKLSKQLETRKLKRVYWAFIWGIMQPMKGTIEANIGRSKQNRKKMAVVSSGKSAITHYETREVYKMSASLLECRLETGRTHQIRVHLTNKGHSILGDQIYGGRHTNLLNRLTNEAQELVKDLSRQALHAKEIGFYHPETGEYLEFSCDLPYDLAALKDKLDTLRASRG